GGPLPRGRVARQRPAPASPGKHVTRPSYGCYMVIRSSWVSLQITPGSGNTWTAALTPVYVSLDNFPAPVPLTTDNFPPVGSYNSLVLGNPADLTVAVPSRYGNGIIARKFRHQIPPLPCPPFCPLPPPCLPCPPDYYA